MASIVDERGYNQMFKSSSASALRLRRRAEVIVKQMRLPKAPEQRQRRRILEIGCGTGEMALLLAQLTGARVTGVDISARFIEQARAIHRDPNLSFAVVDLSKESPGSDADKYDYVVGNGILHHLYYHLDSVLPALARWLAPGGRLIFWEPNLYNPYIYLIFTFQRFRRLAKLEPDEMAFTGSFIAAKLKQARFTDIQVSTRDFLLPNTPAPLIGSAIAAGRILESIPGVRRMAQSVFLCATRPES